MALQTGYQTNVTLRQSRWGRPGDFAYSTERRVEGGDVLAADMVPFGFGALQLVANAANRDDPFNKAIAALSNDSNRAFGAFQMPNTIAEYKTQDTAGFRYRIVIPIVNSTGIQVVRGGSPIARPVIPATRESDDSGPVLPQDGHTTSFVPPSNPEDAALVAGYLSQGYAPGSPVEWVDSIGDLVIWSGKAAGRGDPVYMRYDFLGGNSPNATSDTLNTMPLGSFANEPDGAAAAAQAEWVMLPGAQFTEDSAGPGLVPIRLSQIMPSLTDLIKAQHATEWAK